MAKKSIPVSYFAQTNLQLYNQMVAAGYDETDLALIMNAYQLATTIFVGCYRRSGKTQLAHLIGTASIMVWLKRSSTTVAAALLHAAYAEGDFGGQSIQKELRKATSPEVQRLIAAYYRLPWQYEPTQVNGLITRISHMTDAEREVVLLRVANELEDYLDAAPGYHERKDGRLTYLDEVSLCRLAQALGQPRLVTEIQQQSTLLKASLASFPAAFRRKYVRFNAPRSYGLTLSGYWRKLQRCYRRIHKLGLLEVSKALRRRFKLLLRGRT
ncbi:MAG: HD domain-containing protein [Nanoarchaeota archaeon]